MIFIIRGGASIGNPIRVKGSFNIGRFFAEIYLGLQDNIMEKITYSLSDTIHTYCYFVTDSTCQVIGSVTAIAPKVGSITFSRIDYENKILSGTFNFKVPISSCDTLNVTDGRFDISY